MRNFKIKKIKKRTKKIKLFLNSIKEKNFLINKSYNNTPWIHFNNKNFSFNVIILSKQIIGIVVIIKLKLNTHLQFFYISKKYRSKQIGKKVLEKILPKKKFTTVHVPKKLTNKTINFYKKNKFIKSKIKEKNILVNYWIARCNKFDKKTFKEKFLLYRNLR